MVFEDGKYYPMMKAIRGEQCYEEEIEYLFGSALLKNRNPVLKQFLLKEQSSVEKIMEHLKNTDTRTCLLYTSIWSRITGDMHEFPGRGKRLAALPGNFCCL